MTTTRARLRGGIDLGGDEDPDRRDRRPERRARQGPRAYSPRGPVGRCSGHGRHAAGGAGVGRSVAGAARRRRSRRAGRDRPRDRLGLALRQHPRLDGLLPARCDPDRRPRRAGAHRQRRRRRDRGRVPPRRRQGVPLGARRLLGHRRRRRAGAERPALVGPWRVGRDRSRRGADGRPAVPVRPPGLHGGVCRARRDGGPGPRRGRRWQEDEPVRDHGASAARIASRAASGRRPWRRATTSRPS